MATVETYDAFHGYLEAEWTGVPVRWENENVTLPPTVTTFILVELYAGLYQQESMGAPGDNLWREQGMLRLHVMARRGTDPRAARVIATDLSLLFRERGPGGIRIIDMSVGSGAPGENDGNYYPTTLQVGFERDSL